MRKSFHSGSIKRTVTVRATRERVWRTVSDIIGMPRWAAGVNFCRLLTATGRGIGAARSIAFDDGCIVEEHVVAWRPGESFSYVAVSGLPLRAYVATISLEKGHDESTRITWQSYLNSEKMTEGQFAEFLAFMGAFYEASLENLKVLLEKRRVKG